MHREILSENQIKLLPLVKSFSSNFGLVGGTAIALHLGHRRSIDFDLFTYGKFSGRRIRDAIKSKHSIQTVLFERSCELTIVVDNVKITFYSYPYKINYSERFEGVIKVPDLLTLAAMKAFALGRRAKWKDYVDLYFVFKAHTLTQVVGRARETFHTEFNERLFREQLSYYDDVNYSEGIEYFPGFAVDDSEIKAGLTKESLK